MIYNLEFLNKYVSKEEIGFYKNEVNYIHNQELVSNKPFSLWLEYPKNIDVEQMVNFTNNLKKKVDTLIVIGIGGSYLGAKAAIDLLKPNCDDVYFVGPSLDKEELDKLLILCQVREVAINVISKSGTTMETSIYFEVFKKALIDKYGENYNEHIICTTSEGSKLAIDAENNNYYLYFLPDDIGGRYSVISAVGLIPMAFANIDIKRLINGAINAINELSDVNNNAYKYAVIRNILYKKGYCVEIFLSYNKTFEGFNEWLKQLFGESEGKSNMGILPTSVMFPRDLHSLGQYIQEGRRFIFETGIKTKTKEFVNNAYINNEFFDKINDSIVIGSAQAHYSGGVPINLFEIDNIFEEELGYLFFFFEKACAMSAFLLGVNPFNQPGVEEYKKNIKNLLK